MRKFQFRIFFSFFFARTLSKLYNNHATTATHQNTHFILICFCLLEKKIFWNFFVQYIFYLFVSKATVKTRQRLVIHNPVFLTFFLSLTKQNIVKSTELFIFEAGSARSGIKFKISLFLRLEIKEKTNLEATIVLIHDFGKQKFVDKKKLEAIL